MKEKTKEILTDILFDIAAGILIAIGTYNFATAAKFPMSGFNGIGMIFYHLWGLPIGTVVLVLNIPTAIVCYKALGKEFMLKSAKSILITSAIWTMWHPCFRFIPATRFLRLYAQRFLQGSAVL